jgi:hypothetical protein
MSINLTLILKAVGHRGVKDAFHSNQIKIQDVKSKKNLKINMSHQQSLLFQDFSVKTLF